MFHGKKPENLYNLTTHQLSNFLYYKRLSSYFKNLGTAFVLTIRELTRLKTKKMKKLILTSIIIALFTTGTALRAQERNEDYLGLPGDNLNLYAVMKLFQESKTLEEFEKNLNDENSRINNLDLNGDNMTDYIRVFDNVDGDVHNIVLQVAINARENQDVAVFTVQRYANGNVEVQLVGDEDLYGKNYIVEPIFDESDNMQTPNPGYTGNAALINGQPVTVIRTTRVEIAAWPLIRFIYLPGYSVWRSSWYWGYYPPYWRPWSPFYWHYYYGYHHNYYDYYYGHYRVWHSHRYQRWNDYYYSSRRSYSPAVRERINTGNYRATYSRPESRRDGEALYARTQSEQVSRRTDNSGNNNQVRPDNNRANNQANTDNIRSNSQIRRSNPVQDKVINRYNTTPRNETGTVTRPSNPSQQNKNNVTSRTEGRVNPGQSSRQQTAPKTVTSRPSAPPKSKAVSTPERRSTSSSKPATSVKKEKTTTKSQSGRR